MKKNIRKSFRLFIHDLFLTWGIIEEKSKKSDSQNICFCFTILYFTKILTSWMDKRFDCSMIQFHISGCFVQYSKPKECFFWVMFFPVVILLESSNYHLKYLPIFYRNMVDEMHTRAKWIIESTRILLWIIYFQEN